MNSEIPNLNETSAARDLELQTTFLRAFNLVDELTDLQRKAIPGAHVTLTYDQMTRFTCMLSFCADYAAGSAGVPPNHWRKVLIDEGDKS